MTSNSASNIALKGWAILIILLFPYIATDGFHTDKKISLTKLVEASDYTTTFYVSGKLALERRLSEIYPPITATTLHTTRYNELAHQILPNFVPGLTATCPYFPLVPFMLSPLTVLPPAMALFGWQVLSLICLAGCSLLIDRLREKNKPSVFWLSFLFFPVIHCVFIGQSALVLGLLPLTTGFFALRKNKSLLAGLLFSITFLKPQFIVVAAFVSLSRIFRKDYRALVGLILGTLLICLLNLLLFGPESFSLWLGAMQVTDHVYSDLHNGVVERIVACLPRLVLLSTPPESHSIVKPLLLCSSLIFTSLALFAIWRTAKRKIDDAEFQNYVLLAALSLIPLVVPYLFLYDLSAFVLGWAAVEVMGGQFKSTIRLFVIAFDVYFVINIIPVLHPIASPWILLLIYLVVYRRLLVAGWRTDAVSQEATPA